MLDYSASLSLYQTLTGNDTTSNQTLGATLLNEGQRFMLGAVSWPFLESQQTIATVASQQFYTLAGNLDKPIDVTVTIGTTKYTPTQARSWEEWNYINATTGVTSDAPSYFFIYNGTIGLWPIPSSSSNTITVDYQKVVRDISVANYTTGTIVSIANAGTAVVGSGSSWTTTMAGRFIRITYSNTANKGDGLWYQIASVNSATTLTLTNSYIGTTIAAGAAEYTIGDCFVIPEKYQMGPVYYAVSEYWRKEGEDGRADRFQAKYELLMTQMSADVGRKTVDRVISSDDIEDVQLRNPNNFLYIT